MPIFAINAVFRGVFAAFGPLCVAFMRSLLLTQHSYAQPAEKALGVAWWFVKLIARVR